MPVTNFDISLAALPRSRFDDTGAWRLLQRVGLGGSWADVQRVRAMGVVDAVEHLVRYQAIEAEGLEPPELDPDVIRPIGEDIRQTLRDARRRGEMNAGAAQELRQRVQNQVVRARATDRRQFADLQDWWIRRMQGTPRPAEEKLVLLWHDHFATRYRDVRDAYLLYRQQLLFRQHANGSFAELARGVVRDPAMIRFLNNDRSSARQPNENLARELMELFTLGEGHYSEQDIREVARALTGYTVDDNEFVFRGWMHDGDDKTVLGQRGRHDGDDVVELLLRHEACPRFVAGKLYRHLVADVPEDWRAMPPRRRAVVEQLARQLASAQGNMRPVIERLLASRHFHDPVHAGGQIKPPAQLLAGTVRALGLPRRDERQLRQAMQAMGQDLFNPPTVGGWPGGRSWISSSTLFVRQNLAAYLITGVDPRGFTRAADERAIADALTPRRMGWDPVDLVHDLDSRRPDAAADRLVNLMLGPHAPGGAGSARDRVRSFLRGRGRGQGSVDAVWLARTLLLITAMPEYQLM